MPLPPGPDAEGRLLYFAEHLGSLHAAPDMRWLAGRFEFVGEKALGAALSLLLTVDEAGTYRAVAPSQQAPASARQLRTELKISGAVCDGALPAVLAEVERQARVRVVSVAELFGAEPPSVAAADAIVSPVTHDREPIGAAVFIVEPSQLNQEMARVLAAHAGVAVYQLRQREEARRLHSVDPVLWLPDEQFLLSQLTREVSRARRYQRELGVAVLRLANEDEIRRMFGDFFGDHLMRRIGSLLLAQVRDSDVLGALCGGFAVIHNDTSFAGTRLSGERLRDAVAQMVVQRFPEVPHPQVAVIAAGYPETADTIEALLAQLSANAHATDAAA